MENIIKDNKEKVRKVVFVVGKLRQVVEKETLKIAESLDVERKIFGQNKSLATTCAAEVLKGEIIIIWVKKTKNQRAFGVVTVDNEGIIANYVEKPKKFVSWFGDNRITLSQKRGRINKRVDTINYK